MGTSSSNKGPKGRPNPVPEWENDSNQNRPSDSGGEIPSKPDTSDNLEEQNENDATEQISWSDVRRSFTALTKTTSKSNFKKFTAKYRKASGGKRGLSRSAIGGKKGAIILVDFLDTISKVGIEETLKKFKIGDISDLKAEGAINRIASIFNEIDGTDEGSAASSAAIETVNKLYNDYIESPNDINELDVKHISDYLEFYISKYIFERISIEITNALEVKDLKVSEVKNIEAQISLFIDAEVKLKFSHVNFSEMNLREKNNIISKIFQDAYSLI